MNHYLFALIFFLPAGFANVAPIIANKIPILNRWNSPIDLNLRFRGKRLLGPNKSWRGLITGTIAGGLVGLIIYPLLSNQISSSIEHFLIGAVIGFGSLLGDAVESFFKRQKGIKSGSSWLLFDQLDYIIGAMLFSLLFIRLPLADYLVVIATYFIGHLLMTYLGFILHLKDKPI